MAELGRWGGPRLSGAVGVILKTVSFVLGTTESH